MHEPKNPWVLSVRSEALRKSIPMDLFLQISVLTVDILNSSYQIDSQLHPNAALSCIVSNGLSNQNIGLQWITHPEMILRYVYCIAISQVHLDLQWSVYHVHD